MATNRDLSAAGTYHNGTKHSLQSIRNNPHSLDWDNQPLAFKIYSSLEPIPLPSDLLPVRTPTLAAIAATRGISGKESVPDIRTLATALFLSAGITKRRSYPGGELFFRAAACTGALYHIDLYLVCGDLPGLAAGVYHFGPHDFSLRCLRIGDYRGLLTQASSQEQAVMHAPVTIVCTSTYWRNAWKYQARTYRHCFWDAGTLLANSLAVAAGLEIPTRVVAGFVDAEVNRLLDLDVKHEVALALLPLGYTAQPTPEAVPALPSLNFPTVALSQREVDYPTIHTMHAASSLVDTTEVTGWRGGTPQKSGAVSTGKLFPLISLSDPELPDTPLDQVIRHRGSSRSFARQPISFTQLSTLLQRATQGVPADFLDPAGTMLTDLYLIVNAVDDLPSGAYVFHPDRQALELLREGNFRRETGYLGLGQELPADASVNIFCLTDLPPILACFGNRGYRVAQLEAAIIGGKCYLAAYGQGLGATGLTFFDDDVITFFSPHAAGKSVMFLTAVGKPAKKRVLAQA